MLGTSTEAYRKFYDFAAQKIQTAVADTKEDPLQALRDDPCWFMRRAGMEPDEWQLLASQSKADKMMLNCYRQSGKTTVVGNIVLNGVCLKSNSLWLIISASQDQSGEMFDRIMRIYEASGSIVPPAPGHLGDRTSELHLANGSRILPKPMNPKTIRVYTADGIILDEGSQILDEVYNAILPMLIRRRGRLITLSTPFGRRGWFHNAWENEEGWEKYRVPLEESPTPPINGLIYNKVCYPGDEAWEKIQRDRRNRGERWYKQEYLCSFEADTGSIFHPDDIKAAFRPEMGPLWLEGIDGPRQENPYQEAFQRGMGPMRIPGVD